eukprot:gene24543-biopygen5941
MRTHLNLGSPPHLEEVDRAHLSPRIGFAPAAAGVGGGGRAPLSPSPRRRPTSQTAYTVDLLLLQWRRGGSTPNKCGLPAPAIISGYRGRTDATVNPTKPTQTTATTPNHHTTAIQWGPQNAKRRGRCRKNATPAPKAPGNLENGLPTLRTHCDAFQTQAPLCPVPLCSAPLCPVPLCSVPLCPVALCSVPLCPVPLCTVSFPFPSLVLLFPVPLPIERVPFVMRGVHRFPFSLPRQSGSMPGKNPQQGGGAKVCPICPIFWAKYPKSMGTTTTRHDLKGVNFGQIVSHKLGKTSHLR